MTSDLPIDGQREATSVQAIALERVRRGKALTDRQRGALWAGVVTGVGDHAARCSAALTEDELRTGPKGGKA